MNFRRFASLVFLGAIATLSSGCATSPARPVEADGTYCHRVGKTYRQTLTCTALPVPSAAVEADAKRFEATPEAGMLYIVRRRWGDMANRVPVFVDDQPAVLTIPYSVVRVRLRPGNHQVVIEWEAKRHVTYVNARAGEVLFVEVEGSVWAWGSTYSWAEPDAEGARRRALRSKLIADVNLGP
ncbi:hypothetical protein [Methylibium sp.]|uniref:hypothetical protein n=1 Tax=Methylibium sp. TaxID=2067992 RepID=UPI003D11EDE6